MYPELEPECEFPGKWEFWEAVYEKSDTEPVFLVEGAAGSGKSTFAKFMTYPLLPSLGFDLPGRNRAVVNTDWFQHPRGSPETTSFDLTDWFRWGQDGLDGHIGRVIADFAAGRSRHIFYHTFDHYTGRCDGEEVVGLTSGYLIIEGYFAASEVVKGTCRLHGKEAVVLVVNTLDEELRKARTIWRAQRWRSRPPEAQHQLLENILDPQWERRKTVIGKPDFWVINDTDFVGFV